MIVRILEDRQYELGAEAADRLMALDATLEAALDAGNEDEFRVALEALISEVRREGRPLDPAVIVPSDLALPPEGATIDEVRTVLASESPEP